MSAGLQIYNDNNILIIDENWVTPCLRQSGTVYATSNLFYNGAGVYSGFYVDVNYSGGESPIIAINKAQYNGRTDVAACIVGVYSTDSVNWVFRLCVFGSMGRGDFDRSVNYYIFDRPAVTGGAGLEVFDASGKIVFSSMYKPLILLPFASNQPNGTYAFHMLSPVSVVNDNTEVEISSGGSPIFRDIYRIGIRGAFSTPNGVYVVDWQSNGNGRYDYAPSIYETGAGSETPNLMMRIL